MVGDIFQPTHLLFVLVVMLLVLGPKRLPEVGRTLGSGIRDFQAAIKGETPEKREEIEGEPWHPDPDPEPESEEKHDFAHQGSRTAESHEFAHEEHDVAPASAASTTTANGTATQPTATQPSESTQDAAARSQAANTASTADKHEFAYESVEPADKPSGPSS